MALQYNFEAVLQKEHYGPILALSFNADATLIACGSSPDGKLTIWSCRTWELLVVVSCYHNQDCGFLCSGWLPGRTNLLLCGLESGQIVCIKIEPDYVLASGYSVHKMPVECLSFCDTFEWLATGAFHEVKVWSYQTEGSIEWDLMNTLGLPRSLGENRDAEVIVTSLNWVTNDNSSPTLLVTYLNHGVVFWEIGSDRNQDAHCLSILSFAANTSISPDHRYIAISNLTTGFDVYDITTKSPLRGFLHINSRPSFAPVSFVHDGFALLGGTSNGVARIWDVTTGYAIEPLVHKENDSVWALASYSDIASGQILLATSAKAHNRLPYVVIWKARDIYEKGNVRNGELSKSVHKQRHTCALFFVASLIVAFVAAGMVHTVMST